MCYTYNEVKNWTVDTYNDVKETVKDAIAWVDTNVINPTGNALANAGRQIKNGFTTVANAIADNVGAKVSTSKEKTLNTDYYFFATVENGIGYSKDFGGEKPVNFFASVGEKWWEFWEWPVGVDVNINGLQYGRWLWFSDITTEKSAAIFIAKYISACFWEFSSGIPRE